MWVVLQRRKGSLFFCLWKDHVSVSTKMDAKPQKTTWATSPLCSASVSGTEHKKKNNNYKGVCFDRIQLSFTLSGRDSLWKHMNNQISSSYSCFFTSQTIRFFVLIAAQPTTLQTAALVDDRQFSHLCWWIENGPFLDKSWGWPETFKVRHIEKSI